MPNIQIHDDFLPSDTFHELKDFIVDNPDALFEYPLDEEVSMLVSEVPESFKQVIIKTLEEKEGTPVEPITMYYRVNTSDFDTKDRIHCDLDVQGVEPKRAGVLYLTQPSPNDSRQVSDGTAFWLEHGGENHFDHDIDYHDCVLNSPGAFNFWLDFVVSARYNRMLTYPARYFHSRYPAKAWGEREGNLDEARIVVVVFYS